jgi:hypothetical protein
VFFSIFGCFWPVLGCKSEQNGAKGEGQGGAGAQDQENCRENDTRGDGLCVIWAENRCFGGENRGF